MRMDSAVGRPAERTKVAAQDPGAVSSALRTPNVSRQSVAAGAERLALSLDAELRNNPVGGRLVAFSSARRGEGTATVIATLAHYLTSVLGRNVLVLDAGAGHDLSRSLRGVPALPLREIVLRLPTDATLVTPLAGKLTLTVLDLADGADNDLLFANETLGRLRQVYHYVLVDCASLAESPFVAARGRLFDGIAVVVEAGRTRWQVVQHLREVCEGAGGRVLGVVLNNRRYYVPSWLYRWL